MGSVESFDEWLSFRLDAVLLEHRFGSLSLTEAVLAWWMSYDVVAVATGNQTATFALRSGDTWAWLRVAHVVDRVRPSGTWAPAWNWDDLPVAERYRVLAEAGEQAVVANFTTVCLMAAEWAHSQQRPEGVRPHLRAGSERAREGDPHVFLAALVNAYEGPELEAARTLGVLRGYRMPCGARVGRARVDVPVQNDDC